MANAVSAALRSPILGGEAISLSPAPIIARDGYELRYARYSATREARGVVACIHGIQSHSGWYSHSCRRLADAGFETYFFDRRGSGMNLADRGYCTGYLQLIHDIGAEIRMIREQHPGLPVTLLAISWGGKLAAAAIQRQRDLVDALVLVCPGFFAKVAPTFREKLAIGLSSVFWRRRMINVPLSDPALFTAEPVWQEFIRQDPQSLRKASARMLMSSKLLSWPLMMAPKSIHVPSLLMLGGLDRIINNEKTLAYFQRFAAAKKDVLNYPTAHHTLEFEPARDAIFDDLISWLASNASR